MSKKVILCVDDEKIISDSLKMQLKKRFAAKYVYEFAESADEAFDIINELVEEKIQVLVIVSDWLMPGIKGDEFLIRIHQKFPQIVKVMLTGQADENAVRNAEEKANLYCCLYKPWKEEDLFDAIESGPEVK